MNVRNKIYGELRIAKAKELQKIGSNREAQSSYRESMITADFNSFYCLLIVTPEVTDSYETMNILRYFEFPFKIEEDNILRQIVKHEMGFRKEDEVRFKVISHIINSP
jgi:hypothetical protein